MVEGLLMQWRPRQIRRNERFNLQHLRVLKGRVNTPTLMINMTFQSTRLREKLKLKFNFAFQPIILLASERAWQSPIKAIVGEWRRSILF
jgi:hypothetical protein